MDNKKKAALAVACALGASSVISSSIAAPVISESGKHTYDDDIIIPTLADPLDPNNDASMALPANIRIPVSNNPSESFPLVIFINSWTLDEYQYGNQSERLADLGYAVLSITTRGFGRAPGLVDTAGERDVYDVMQTITYALENYPVDEDAIALAGVSYGAGIGLVTGLQDERVDAIVAMSGWGNLVESLWGGNVPNKTWLNVLVGSGNLLGDLNPLIQQYYNNMQEHKDIEETKAWGAIRSPITYLEQANSRPNPPALFASNNLHDYLFQPNSMVELLSGYDGPWRCEFNYGTHGQGEAGGLIGDGETNIPWTAATEWLDHYLKGIDNGIDGLKPVNTVVRSRDQSLPGIRESFDGFPVADPANNKVLYLSANEADFGGLSDIEDLGFSSLSFDTTESQVWPGAIQGAVMGGSLFYFLDDINFDHSVAFLSEPLDDDLYIRGEVNLELWADIEDKSQYFAYLLDYEPDTGKARWIGHAPFTWHESEFGEVPEGPTKLNIEFYWTSYDVDVGNQLLLVVEGKDGDYWRYDDTPLTNMVVFGPEQINKLSIPRIAETTTYLTVSDPDGSETNPNARGLGGGGSSYGPGGGGFGLLWLSLVSLLAVSRYRRSYQLRI
ncbi:MAG: hypothetical protein MI867_14385 [Pseudomonadales bacterium]|nr:hypothetical protein [Pseudomonadales bacterium]